MKREHLKAAYTLKKRLYVDNFLSEMDALVVRNRVEGTNKF
jgi:hypothetical protein